MSQLAGNETKSAVQKPNEECTAFCPKCGSDLYIMRTECVCKNKDCNWRCNGCASEDDV